MSQITSQQQSIDSAKLYRMILDGTDFSLVDVRNRDAFSNWHIEGRTPLRTFNVPYFEIMAEGEADNLADAAAAYAKAHWENELPKDKPVVVVCAKEQTATFVAEGLRRLGYEAFSLVGGMAAWGDYYAVHPIVEDERLSVWQISRPARGCLSYIAASDGEAVIIDPLRHTDVYTDFVRERNLKVAGVFDTHGHADHISGGPSLAEEFNVPYYLHPYDAIHPLDVLPANLHYEPLRDDMHFRVGQVDLRAIHVPGHTLGNIVFLLDGKYLFSGDSIFVSSVARPDLGGQGEKWAPIHFRSLQKLLQLDPNTWVLPGHFSRFDEADETGTVRAQLGDLLNRNEDLQRLADGETAFVDFMLSHLPKFPPQYIDIKRVNAGLLAPTDDESSELELGRNICALSHAYQQS